MYHFIIMSELKVLSANIIAWFHFWIQTHVVAGYGEQFREWTSWAIASGVGILTMIYLCKKIFFGSKPQKQEPKKNG